MRIAVTSKSFSRNEVLIAQLKRHFSDVKLNNADRLLSKGETIDFLQDCDGAIVALEKIDGSILVACPRLKVIAKYGVGIDNINQIDCVTSGVAVRWTAGVNKTSVAEMALGFMLMLLRNLYVSSVKLKRGVWDKNGGYSLSGKIIGIIGLGYVGQELVRLLAPFGCKILINDIVDKADFCAQQNLHSVSKEFLFANSDVVTIHTPLTDLTRELISESSLAQMKPSAIFINTARGDLVNLTHLKTALQKGGIAGAAIDVYDIEPPTDEELLGLENLICTPHIGGNSIEAVVAMGESAIGHLVEFKKALA